MYKCIYTYNNNSKNNNYHHHYYYHYYYCMFMFIIIICMPGQCLRELYGEFRLGVVVYNMLVLFLYVVLTVLFV